MFRLIILSILLLLSLLVIFKAPTYHLWLTAIIVTEFPLIFVGLTLLLLVAGIWANHYQLAGSLVGTIAFILFLSPVFQAYVIGRSLEKELFDVSGSGKTTDKAPFDATGMLTGINNKTLSAKVYTYISYADKALDLDFYPAQAKGKRPCVLVVHGGSWKSGDNKQLPELNAYLATKGYHVAAINYRLAPQYRNPSPVEDVKAALTYLNLHAEELRLDTSNIVLLGRSAGAQIALLAAYTLNVPGMKGVIDFYGPADMVWGYSIPANPLVLDSRKVMEDYLGGTYNQSPQNYAASSPISFVSQSSVPTLIIHGKNDVLVAYEHSKRLQKKLNEHGVMNYFLSLPWATHGFDYTLNGPGGQLSTYAVLKFLRSVVN